MAALRPLGPAPITIASCLSFCLGGTLVASKAAKVTLRIESEPASRGSNMSTNTQNDALKYGAMTLGALALGRLIWRKMTEYDLRNKTVLITGGSRGLGLVLAREFAREGAQI